MDFILNANTKIKYSGDKKPIINAVEILTRDIKKKFNPLGINENVIELADNAMIENEMFEISAGEKMTIYASSELGFVYGLLYISEKFLGILPFWFWMDQKIEKTDSISVIDGRYSGIKPVIKYRGWFLNDEVLIMKWAIGGDKVEPWKMAFEALLRCGGNMVIPGTDKNSKIYRQLASDMGLWITHHHAEPLGAEMFVRAYPDKEPNYAETPELFVKLWEDAVIEQKDMNMIWSVGFRGQGDCPFWSHDTSGRFDTPEKRGKAISDVIELQRQLVLKYVEKPIFCTNLYGEIMELYEEGHIHFADDVIKIGADNGFGKMVTRRRDNHVVRISSLPKKPEAHGGIYYHVSFYDLQAANHITMLPNSVDFVNKELNEVIEKNAVDFWVINCSNVRPHAYYLDAVRRKWYGEEISDENHSVKFTSLYYGENSDIAEMYKQYHNAMIAYGTEEDEHAGEQFYTENVRLLIHAFFNNKTDGTPGLRWLQGQQYPLDEQVEKFSAMCENNFKNIEAFYNKCAEVSTKLNGDAKRLFDSTLFMQTAIHYYCTMGVIAFGKAYKEYRNGNFKKSFVLFGDSAELFAKANSQMRDSEYDVWNGFYFNDCFADIKHTAYMIEKMMGVARERGDNARHDLWYRDTMYAPEDRGVFTLLVNDNHMTDKELYIEMKKQGM